MKKEHLSVLIQCVFYSFAGLNHFFNPDFYYPLIPEYFGFKYEINILSGLIEICFGIASFFSSTRKYASYGIIAMLVCFIPSHVHFIMIGSCINSGLCVHPIIGYIRLLIIHPLLIAWAYYNSKK